MTSGHLNKQNQIAVVTEWELFADSAWRQTLHLSNRPDPGELHDHKPQNGIYDYEEQTLVSFAEL